MRITWIGGWGVAPESLRPIAEMYFPQSEHAILAPTANVVESVGSPDLTVAWSLGALRVLEAASRGTQSGGMVMLLAPFIAFPAESKLGGRCSATQVKFLRRWLQREPVAALADFYQRAGLGTAPTELPYALPDLLEGLDRLAEDASPALRAFAARGLPRSWQALIGDDDALLDAETVRVSLPGCVRVRGAGHAIADLLRASQA
jgi:hypothetical protein